MSELKYSNLTATVIICDNRLDLADLVAKLRNITYNPRRFNAIIMRIRYPSVTGLIFHTGKIVIVGAKTIDDTKKGARRIARAVQKACTHRIYCGEFKIRNIVAYMNLRYKVEIEKLYDSRRFNSYYEPEFFSPAVKCFYSKSQNLIALVF